MWSSASSSWSDPEIIGLIVGAVIGGCSPLLFGLLLVILGFGCTGITLGSCAAATMSLIHPVGTGSIFAYFQSCGMTFPWGPLGYIFLAIIGGGAGFAIGITCFDHTNSTIANITELVMPSEEDSEKHAQRFVQDVLEYNNGDDYINSHKNPEESVPWYYGHSNLYLALSISTLGCLVLIAIYKYVKRQRHRLDYETI